MTRPTFKLQNAVLAGALVCTLTVTAGPAFAVILDRIAASVGSHVITETEVIRDVRIADFLDQKPFAITGEEKRKAAGRLVDQYLILHDAEVNHVSLPTDADAEHILGLTKAQFSSDTEYRSALERYGIKEADVQNHMLAGLRTLRYTDFRFRPEIQLSDEEMRAYYTAAMARRPDTRVPAPTFEASRDGIQKLMTDERVMQALDRWLVVVREENHVHFWESASK